MNNFNNYKELIKPSWAPPSWVFGPVWTVLYLIIAYTYLCAFIKIFSLTLPSFLLWPLILNLIFNFSFTPIQFGLKNNLLASVDILLVLCTLIWAVFSVYKFFPLFSYLNLPYLLWVSFATILQLTITYLNKK